MNADIVLQPDDSMALFDYGLMLGGAPCMKVMSKNLREAAVGIHLLDSSIIRNKFSSIVAVNGGQVSKFPSNVLLSGLGVVNSDKSWRVVLLTFLR